MQGESRLPDVCSDRPQKATRACRTECTPRRQPSRSPEFYPDSAPAPSGCPTRFRHQPAAHPARPVRQRCEAGLPPAPAPADWRTHGTTLSSFTCPVHFCCGIAIRSPPAPPAAGILPRQVCLPPPMPPIIDQFPLPSSFSAVPQDPRRARAANSAAAGATAPASLSSANPPTLSSLPPPVPLAPSGGTPPGHANPVQSTLAPPVTVLGGQSKAQYASGDFHVQPHAGGVPGLQSSSSKPAPSDAKEEKEKTSLGMLSGSIKDEDLVHIYNGPVGVKVLCLALLAIPSAQRLLLTIAGL